MKKGVSSSDDEASPEEQSSLQKATAQYDSWRGYWNTSAVLTQGGASMSTAATPGPPSTMTGLSL